MLEFRQKNVNCLGQSNLSFRKKDKNLNNHYQLLIMKHHLKFDMHIKSNSANKM